MAGTNSPRMLDREKPDFVDIITPPETHFEVVEQAAQRGIAIICQKPLAPTWEESVAVVDVVRKHGVRFMVHENFRWQPWYREIKRLLDVRRTGRTLLHRRSACGWATAGRKTPTSRVSPISETYPRLFVYETGVHFLDTFRFLGGEISSVYARLQKRNADIKGEDAAQIVCGFASGATAMLDASRYNEVRRGRRTLYVWHGPCRRQQRPRGTRSRGQPHAEAPRPALADARRILMSAAASPATASITCSATLSTAC